VCASVNNPSAGTTGIDGGETLTSDAAGMEPPSYQVVVVRAWREAGGLRIRLIAHGGSERHWVVGSIAEASDLLESILSELLATPRRAPETSPGGGRGP
jgi:hypothetical protein